MKTSTVNAATPFTRRFAGWPNAVGIYLLCGGGACFMLLPFAWLARSSLMGINQIFRFPPEWIPDPVQWQNFPDALATLMLPYAITLIPTFLLWARLGLTNTAWPLVLPRWFGGGAFYIFLLRQFFRTIPREQDEAATLDGVGRSGCRSLGPAVVGGVGRAA